MKDRCAGEVEGDLQVSLSLGCAVKEKIGEDINETMRKAEEFMYHQKLISHL